MGIVIWITGMRLLAAVHAYRTEDEAAQRFCIGVFVVGTLVLAFLAS